MWQSVVIFSIFISLPRLHSPNLMNRIIDDDLLNKWDIRFTILTKIFNGDILNCFDSNDNHLRVYVSHSGYKNTLVIAYNRNTNRKSLEEFCGCRKCDETKISIRVLLRNDKVRAQCNHRGTLAFYINSFKRGGSVYSKFIDLYIGEYAKNVRYHRLTNNLGSLESLTFNNNSLIFLIEGNREDSTTQKISLRQTSTTIHSIISKYGINSTTANKESDKTQNRVTRHLNTERDAAISTKTSLRQIKDKVTVSMNTNKDSTKTQNRVTSFTNTERDSAISTVRQIKYKDDSSQCQSSIWKWMALGEAILIIMVSINKRDLIARIQKMKQKWHTVEIPITESVSKHNSMYSSINEFVRNSMNPCSDASDGSYMLPRALSSIEKAPSPPPRDKPPIFKHVESVIDESILKIWEPLDNYQSIVESIRFSREVTVKESDPRVLEVRQVSMIEDLPSLPARDKKANYKK